MYTIRDISVKTGLSKATLRYYEKEGLLPFVKRDCHGSRLYNDENVEWIKYILVLRSTGMSISQIKKYVELYHQGNHTIQERKQLILSHKKHVEDEIMERYSYFKKINYQLILYDILETLVQKQ
ncbi:MerR family transcriptional regulator [Bacillus toyonensis]|uniref:MerR family transcriptional regulator n=1 Tax=Bacillus toyonensis TaxID=155322 RepID=UPI0015D4ED87|nr:MerR family transcriptional regulator [Bacillus toyonensis]